MTDACKFALLCDKAGIFRVTEWLSACYNYNTQEGTMLLKDVIVSIPSGTRIQKQYVYHVRARKYDPEKGFTTEDRVCIGKLCDTEGMMYPNENYESYYSCQDMKDGDLPEFSDTIHIGTRTLIGHILLDTGIDNMLEVLFENEAPLIKDVLAYMIVNESCAYQYFPYFMREYMSFTKKVYSDTTISRLLKNIEEKDRQTFLDAWNRLNSNLSDVYVSYDSTNFSTRNDYDGLSEFGHAKDDEELPQVNLAYVTAQNNGRPLYYELYPGSIHDSAEVRYMLRSIRGYGYKQVGFIFDRAYYSESFLNAMSKEGYFFMIMLKERYKYVQETIGKYRIRLTEQSRCYIRNHEVSGITERVKIGDNSYYVHVYYDDFRASAEKREYLNAVGAMEEELEKKLEEKKWTKEQLKKYEKEFRMRYDSHGILLSCSRKDKVITEKLEGMGYFAILTSRKMEASEALDIYRDRDSIEKMFRMLKSGMEFDHAGVQSRESLESKVFLTFIAAIIRNEIFQRTKALRLEDRKSYTVPAVMKTLDMIEATKSIRSGKYIRRYASTKKQKKILTAFKLKESDLDQLLGEWNG